jgi:uncharacterized protein YqeY
MNLQEKISDDLKQSMIAKDFKKRDFLRVVIGEFNRDTTSKILSDDKVLSILKNMKDNAEMMKNQYEVDLLCEYLPKMLTNDELENIIKDIVDKNGYNSMKDMGKIINELKTNFPSQFDGSVASSLIKKYIQ